MPNLMGLWVRATSLSGTLPSSWPQQLPSLRWLDLATWQDVNFGCRRLNRGLSGRLSPAASDHGLQHPLVGILLKSVLSTPWHCWHNLQAGADMPHAAWVLSTSKDVADAVQHVRVTSPDGFGGPEASRPGADPGRL